MEIYSANKLQDTIHNIYALCKKLDDLAPKPSTYKPVIALAADAINLFNDNEINQPSGRLTVTEYQLFLITHLIAFDTINAKYLWKRIPSSLKGHDGNQVLSETWQLAKYLIEKDYGQAFQ